jgi:hypothetical protein
MEKKLSKDILNLEKEFLKELKSWDDEVWKKFKQTQYETISIGHCIDKECKKSS